VIVRFVDIDGIDDHHCLNFLIIIRSHSSGNLIKEEIHAHTLQY